MVKTTLAFLEYVLAEGELLSACGLVNCLWLIAFGLASLEAKVELEP